MKQNNGNEMTEVVEKVSELERMMKDLVYVQRQTEMKLASFIEEMKEFKQEIREDTRKLKDEMKDFKDEMKEFKDEMKDFKEFTEKNIASLNQKWGELANRLGTIAEDLIMPCFPKTIEKHFGLRDPFATHINTIVRKDGKTKEFDIIIVYEDTVVLNEVKATASPNSIAEFVQFIQSQEFFDYFPHLAGKNILPFVSAMKFADKAVETLTKNKIYAVTPCPDM